MANVFETDVPIPLLADYISASELLIELGISHETLRTYEATPEALFPLGVKIGRRRLYSRRAIREWLRMRVGDPVDDRDAA